MHVHMWEMWSRPVIGKSNPAVDESGTREASASSSRLIGRSLLAAQFALDLAVLTIAHLVAFELRFDFAVPADYRLAATVLLPLVLTIQVSALALTGAYSLVWRYVGLREVVVFARAAALAALPLLLVRLDPLGVFGSDRLLPIPLSVIMIDALLAFAGVVGLRVLRRMVFEREQRQRTATAVASSVQRVLLVGAGRAGITALEALQARGDASLRPIGFVDDDPAELGRVIHGTRVLGTTEDLPRLVREHTIEQVLITMGPAPRRDIRRLVEQCERVPVKVRIIPGMVELLQGDVVTTIRDVVIEDLLGREPVVLEQDHLTPFLTGKRVMITGAGGSIGSELCRQVARFAPESVILVERCEFALFSIDRELRAACPDVDIRPRLADVGDRARMREVFTHERPQIVLHAAAHKHVPLMEGSPCEAIKNNIFGTRTTGELAGEHGVETFVLVSTDKAVRPTSVMGATKRVAELVIQQLDERFATDYIAVRFGNVLGSTGSVVPIFREQIARGGPVTVTHPDMVRFFMTIPEAAQLVLQAGAMRTGGEVFVLDMGEPVRIFDLATDMIKLCGLKPGDDIEVVYSGMRPGEKLYEELSTADEALARTRHPKILSAQMAPQRAAEIERGLEALATIAARGDDMAGRRQLARMVPESQLKLLGIAAAREPAETERPALSVTG